MKLLEIQIGSFQGSADLRMHGFHAGLNPILLPEEDSAKEFSQLLANGIAPDKEFESITSKLELKTGEIKLYGRNRNGTLRAVDGQNIATSAAGLDQALKQIPNENYQAVFTDHLDSSAFMEFCLKNIEILDRFRESSPKPRRRRSQLSFDATYRNTARAPLLAIDEICERWQSDNEICITATNRKRYFQLVQQLNEAETEFSSLDDDLNRLQKTKIPYEAAFSVWHLNERLIQLDENLQYASKVEELVEIRDALQSIDEQILRCRNKIRKAKTRQKQLLTDQDVNKIELIAQCAKEAEVAVQKKTRLDTISRELSDDETSCEEGSVPVLRSSKDTLRRLQPLARELNRCRIAVKQCQTNQISVGKNPPKPMAATSIEFDVIAAADLQRQVDTLQEECDRLLAPQILPKPMTILISGLLVAGSLMLIATFFLGAGRWLIFSTGLVTLLCGWTLRLMGRHTPADTLGRYQKQIQALLESIAEIEKIQASAAKSSPPASANSNLLDDSETARSDYRIAKHNWRDALRAEKLPTHLSPKRLLERFKTTPARAMNQDRQRTREIPNKETEARELSIWVEEWRSRSRKALGDCVDETSSIGDLVTQLNKASLDWNHSHDRLARHESNQMTRHERYQSHLKNLKSRRKELLERCGMDSLKEIDESINEIQKRASIDDDRDEISGQIQATLEACGAASEAHRLAAEFSSMEIKQRISELETEISKKQSKLSAVKCQRAKTKKDLSLFVQKTDRSPISFQRQIDDARIRKHTAAFLSSLILNAALSQKKSSRITQQSPLLKRASVLLQTSSPWTTANLFYSEHHEQLYIKSNARRTLWDNLPGYVARHVATCVRFALIEQFNAGNLERLPVVLSDLGSQSDDAKRTRSVQLIIDFVGHDKQQVFIVLGDRDAALQLSELGIPIAVAHLKRRTQTIDIRGIESTSVVGDHHAGVPHRKVPILRSFPAQEGTEF